MMNMGLSRLVLVHPPKDSKGEAARLAAGANAILDSASVHETLEEALLDQQMVIGTSRHPGRRRKNIRSPRDMATDLITLTGNNRVAIVFGNEVNGLENRDLALCHELVAIPSSGDFPSLNLSHAVMVVAYELFLASGGLPDHESGPLARLDETEGFYRHLQETLHLIDFLERDHPERMMFTFRQIFGRARLHSRDVSVLRGVLSAVGRVCSSGTKAQ
jgi:TrmH family RNA methyltransferase